MLPVRYEKRWQSPSASHNSEHTSADEIFIAVRMKGLFTTVPAIGPWYPSLKHARAVDICVDGVVEEANIVVAIVAIVGVAVTVVFVVAVLDVDVDVVAVAVAVVVEDEDEDDAAVAVAHPPLLESIAFSLSAAMALPTRLLTVLTNEA